MYCAERFVCSAFFIMDIIRMSLFSMIAVCLPSFASPVKSSIAAKEQFCSEWNDESRVEYIEFDGTQYIALNDIHPNYYTYMYVSLDYQLTSIIGGYIQMIGSSSLGATICTGGGYVETISTGIRADLYRHILVFDGTSSPYHCCYDGIKIKEFNRSGNSVRVFTIGSVDNAGTFSFFCYMRFFGMTISQSSTATPQNYFVPWRIGEEGCIKDLVTGKVYLPSVPVLVGPDIN